MKSLAAFCAVLGVCLGLSRHAEAQSLRLAQPNAARFPEVTLYVYPVDARGAPLRGLDPAGFRVLEDGAPAQVLRAQGSGGSLDVCLALDCSMSMLDEGKLEYAKDAAREFLRQLGPDDQAALLTFADGS